MKGGKMNARLFRPVAFAVALLVSVTAAVTGAPRAAGAADGVWLGEYYANPWLSGPPALIRQDPEINFDWGAGSPAPQIPPDNFSVRWTRTLTLDAGRYRFTTTTDDGVRLFLDGQLVIDQWHDQAPTSHSAERDLGNGQHSVRMEYYEAYGGALARLAWARVSPPPPPPGDWRGDYYANPWLSGSPALVRNDPAIDFNWGAGSPAPQIPPDNFSVRWTRSVDFAAGRYRFTTTTDDGVRLYVDGRLIINQWRDQPPTTYNAEIDLGAGQHAVRMEYYEAYGGAMARLTWTRLNPPPPPPATPWRGEYFTNPWLSGSPALVRDDPAIDFNWGYGSPAPQIPPDNFSVRWTRTISLSAGRYRFRTITDDGVRLYVDGKLVMNRWYDMPPTTFNVYLDLGAGNHTVRMEYFEHLGTAEAHLTISSAQSEKPAAVGNIITCARPGTWVRIYRWDGSTWADTNPKGYGPIGSSGRMKLDGFTVDVNRYGQTGQPYRVEVWSDGVRLQSVGNTAAGEAPFRVRADADNYTPWGCP
jgi:hypothetical protein